ncbi:MAG: hypothetical protein Q7J47_01535 [Azoarcus sp.]|nr:hypothetical protein [Azoarcus sp.]PKO50248.1 MAG: hypothetical protein CVU28_13325 [Betaproteobacteria bacterium HGW-Betaproteobacteria-21]
MRDRSGPTNGISIVGAWLVLVLLLLASIGAGQLFHGAPWLPFAIAAIVWVKGTLIARYFIEANHAHPFIQWALRVFIAFVPAFLLLTAWLGERLARWTTL